MIRLLALLALVGCGPGFRIVRTTVDGPDVRVRLRGWKHFRARGPGGVLFEALVENRGAAPLEIDRDAVFLQTASGPRARLPGGWSAHYRVAHGERHRVRCVYYVADLAPGERAALDFSTALRRDGAPVPIAPIELLVR
jgi:hypothetical protein